MPAPTDSTGKMIEVSRYNGLMAKHQAALAELATLKGSGGQGTEAQYGQDTRQTPQQADPEFTDGEIYKVEDGQLVHFEPPMPNQYSEHSQRLAPRKAEPTVQDRLHEWPDISVR